MKVYVGNLSFGIDDEKLREIFSKFGDVEEAVVIKDKYSGRSKGFGFVTFSDDASANKAIKEMNDHEVDGRQLKVNEARPMEERPPRREGGGRGFGGGGGRSFGGPRRRF